MRYSLVLPFILSFGLARIHARGVHQTEDLDEKLEYIRGKLELPGKPHVDVLTSFLKMGSRLFLLVGARLLALFVLSLLPPPAWLSRLVA